MLIQEDVQGGEIMEIKCVKLSKPSEETEKQLHSSTKNSLDIAFDSATAVLTPDKEESECRVGCIRTVLQI